MLSFFFIKIFSFTYLLIFHFIFSYLGCYPFLIIIIILLIIIFIRPHSIFFFPIVCMMCFHIVFHIVCMMWVFFSFIGIRIFSAILIAINWLWGGWLSVLVLVLSLVVKKDCAKMASVSGIKSNAKSTVEAGW